MSFSGEVKKELIQQGGKARHCKLAELQGLIQFGRGEVKPKGEDFFLWFENDSIEIIRKCFTLLKKTYNIEATLEENLGGSGSHRISCQDSRLISISNASLHLDCCKRAYLRGAFLAGGSMSDPRKGYHLEIVCGSLEEVEKLQELLRSFGLDGRFVPRKKMYVFYLKEGTQISEFIGIMAGFVSLMEFENIRIVKEMRNHVNRKVNCETANLNKTVSASVKQHEDILYIKEKLGLETLPQNLQEIARIRLEYPDASLKELGELLEPPIGKSGVNHRLRKLGELASQLRGI